MELLGRPLPEAIRRLRARGVEPAILMSRPPRKGDLQGIPRVIQVGRDGRTLTVGIFKEGIGDKGEESP